MSDKIFIVEKKKKKNKARKLDAFDFDFDFNTDFKILEGSGKCIIKKMDRDTFLKKFG